MKTLQTPKRNKEWFHIEAINCIVNVRDYLKDEKGNTLCRVDVIPDAGYKIEVGTPPLGEGVVIVRKEANQ